MTLKISFFKLMVEDIRRRSWLMAMTALALFVIQPVSIMLAINNMMDQVQNNTKTLEKVAAAYANRVGFQSSGVVAASFGQSASNLVVIIIGLAVIIAFTGFAHLHSREKLDFYHSLPIKRVSFFLVQYCSGIIIYLIPAAICLLLSLVVGMVNGFLQVSVLLLALKAFIVHFLYFLVIYATAILAMVMTGKIVVAFLGFGVFVLYGPCVLFLIRSLMSMFFSTALIDDYGIHLARSIFSPLTYCVNTESILSLGNSSVGTKWLCMAGLVLMILLLHVLCIVLYAIRKTDAAEQAMAFVKTEKIIKILLVIPLSLGIGFWLSGMVASNSFIWLLAGSIVGNFIFSVLIEFIYHMDIKEVLQSKPTMLATMVIGVLITLIFKFDILGYDSYLPDKENVTEMALFYEPINGILGYKSEVSEDSSYTAYYGDRYGLDKYAISDFAPIYEMASEGIRWLNQEDRLDQQRISVRYVLENGSSIYRTYYIPQDVINEQMSELYDQNFKEAIYPILSDDDRKITLIYMTDWNGARTLNLNQDQRDTLMDTYKNELKQISYQDLSGEKRVSDLALETKKDNVFYSGMEEHYPVTTDCLETLALLEEYGYEVPTEPNAQNIDLITVESINEKYNSYISVNFTDLTEIEEILQSISFASIIDYNAIGVEDEDEYYVYIQFHNNSDGLWGCFKKGKVPEFVISGLAAQAEKNGEVTDK